MAENGDFCLVERQCDAMKITLFLDTSTRFAKKQTPETFSRFSRSICFCFLLPTQSANLSGSSYLASLAMQRPIKLVYYAILNFSKRFKRSQMKFNKR